MGSSGRLCEKGYDLLVLEPMHQTYVSYLAEWLKQVSTTGAILGFTQSSSYDVTGVQYDQLPYLHSKRPFGIRDVFLTEPRLCNIRGV